jgi:hypothetical protein
MKKLKRQKEILAFQDGGAMVRQFTWNRNFLSAKEPAGKISAAQARPELQVQRHPAAQLNREQHGVWV